MPAPPRGYAIGKALTPFSETESRRLRRYVEHVKRLRHSSFFEQEGLGLEIKLTSASMSAEVLPRNAHGDELVTTMVARLRNVHAVGRPGAASFPQIVGMLRSHAERKGNQHSRWLLKVLDREEATIRTILDVALIGLVHQRVDAEGNVISSESITPEQAFKDWLYGVYLHDDEERLMRVEQWKAIPVHRYTFLQTATQLSRAYYAFSGSCSRFWRSRRSSAMHPRRRSRRETGRGRAARAC
jgi:hypothetical protein